MRFWTCENKQTQNARARSQRINMNICLSRLLFSTNCIDQQVSIKTDWRLFGEIDVLVLSGCANANIGGTQILMTLDAEKSVF